MTTKIRYDLNYLQQFCGENNIELLRDYSNDKIRCDSILEGKCCNNDCVNDFKKSFKHLIHYSGLCKQCIKGINGKCVIYNWKLLKSYCEERNIILSNDYSKEKIGSVTRIIGICETYDCNTEFNCCFRNLITFGAFCKGCLYKKRTEMSKISNKEKYGVEYVSQVPEIRQKAEKTMLEKYGVKYTTQSSELMDKMKHNNVQKYGVEYVMQNEDFKKKAKETNLEKYGVEYTFQSEEIKQKSRESCYKKYGVNSVSQVPEIRQKAKETTIERYGVENASQSEEIKHRSIETNMKKYGVKFASQNETIKKKTKETLLERYGVENALQNDTIKKKTKETLLERYGVENISQNEDIKNKKKETTFKHYGVESPFQLEETKMKNRIVMRENSELINRKRIQTSLQNWGVEHPAQNTEIAEKSSKRAYKSKDYTFPSGRVERIQGYENYILDHLLQNEQIQEDDIVVKRSEVPEVWYEDANGKKCRYFVDCFIKSQNRCIEAKSTWTAAKKKDCIYLKQQALKGKGYKCEIWVYNNKGEIVEKIF